MKKLMMPLTWNPLVYAVGTLELFNLSVNAFDDTVCTSPHHGYSIFRLLHPNALHSDSFSVSVEVNKRITSDWIPE